MAPNIQGKPVTSSFRTILLDLDGQPLITIDTNEFSILQPDNTVSVQKTGTLIVLVDGTLWTPAMATRANDPITPVVCRTCRRGIDEWFHHELPNCGLLAPQNAERCANCGETCCPRHRKRCSDGELRCLTCARRFRRWALVRGIFMKQVQE